MARTVAQCVAWGFVVRFGVKWAGEIVANKVIANKKGIGADYFTVYECVAQAPSEYFEGL